MTTVPSVLKIIKARASLQSAIAVLSCYMYGPSSFSAFHVTERNADPLSDHGSYLTSERLFKSVHQSSKMD